MSERDPAAEPEDQVVRPPAEEMRGFGSRWGAAGLPLERSRNFKEVNLGYSMADALAEAERCIMCTKPTCIEGCPVGIDIPRFIRHLLVRDLDGALGVIRESNLFPSVCGRVCPQESQCEAQCQVGRFKKTPLEPVAIGRLERFIGDNANAAPAAPPPVERPFGKVAIVGSGPSGLAAAADRAKMGCDVTVYEALHVIGGVLQYGIPSFRLPREIIDREVDNLKALGVRFETNKVIGKTFSVPQLLGEMGFDAAFVGAGAGAPAFLGIPGEFDNPKFTKAIDRVVKAARKHKKALGRLVPTVEQGIALNKLGFDFICYSGDVWVLHNALAEAIGEQRAGCRG